MGEELTVHGARGRRRKSGPRSAQAAAVTNPGLPPQAAERPEDRAARARASDDLLREVTGRPTGVLVSAAADKDAHEKIQPPEGTQAVRYMFLTISNVRRISLRSPKRQSSRGTGQREAVVYQIELKGRSREGIERLRAVLAAAAEQPDPVAALAEMMLVKTPPASVVLRQATLRVRAIEDFLGRYRLLTAPEVDRLPGRVPSRANPSAAASRWRTSGRVFAVRWEGADRYPAFQFRDGEPIPELRGILALLGPSSDGWSHAFWFGSPHSYLEGRAPADLLAEDAPRVLAAATWQFGD